MGDTTLARKRQLLKLATAAADDFLPPEITTHVAADEDWLLCWLEVFQSHDPGVWRKGDRWLVFFYVDSIFECLRIKQQLATEGHCIEEEKTAGRKVTKLNPLFSAYRTYQALVITYAQKLGLNTAKRAASGKANQDHPEKAANAAKNAAAGRTLQTDDRGLLARRPRTLN